MKKSVLITAALAAFAAASASAQVAYSTPDLLVGFQQAGAANDLVLDLGSALTLPTTGTVNFGNVTSALAGLGGAPTGLASWSVGGTIGVTASGSYLKDALWVTSVANPGSFTPLTAAGAVTDFNTLGVGLATNPTNATVTGFTGKGASYVGALTAASYTTQFGNGSYIAQQVAGTGSIDLYLLNSTIAEVKTGKLVTTPQNNLAPTLLGSFALSSAGDLSFTAIPEPSTYAALLGIATLGFVAIRRRKQAAQLVA